MVKPANFKRDQKYPVAFLIHGGPQGSLANEWHYRWNAQTFAGAGYGVVMIDFHGSTGYGQAFTDSISGDWGGKPLEDLKLGFAAALKQFPWLDGDDACALGGSYGGYMINWIAGQWPDRFKCLVSSTTASSTSAACTTRPKSSGFRNGSTAARYRIPAATRNTIRWITSRSGRRRCS